MIACNLYCQLFSLLTILLFPSVFEFTPSDYDASGFYELESDGSCTLSQALLSLLSFRPKENAKLEHLAEEMQLSVGRSFLSRQAQLSSFR